MRILVTGASGYIGKKLVEALSAKDWVEAIVGLDIEEPDLTFPKYTFIKQDIRAPLDDLFERKEITTLAHLAYVLTPIHDKNLMEDINKGGTRNVLAASAKAGVKQILYTSSTTAYGFHPDNDVPLTEESPLRGNDDFTYAKNKKEIEGIMQAFIETHPEITVSIVRPCFVIGPGFENPMANYLKKKIVMLPSNVLPFQFVHEEDVITIMLMLLEKKTRGIFNISGEGTITFAEMIKRLGNFMLPIPWSVIYPLVNVAWFLRLSFLTEFPSPAMRMMVNPWWASSEKLIRELDYTFKYNTREAFEDFAQKTP